MFSFSEAFSQATASALCPEYPRCSRSYCPFTHSLAASIEKNTIAKGENHHSHQTETKTGRQTALRQQDAVNSNATATIAASPSSSSSSDDYDDDDYEGSERKRKRSTETGIMNETESTGAVLTSTLKFDPSSKVGLRQRQKVIDAFMQQLKRKLSDHARLAKEALELEQSIHEKCTPQTYQSLAAEVLQRLRKLPQSAEEFPREFLLTGASKQRDVPFISTDDLLLLLEPLMLTSSQLIELDYPLMEAQLIADYASQQPVTKECDRCKKLFLPQATKPTDQQCRYHWGRLDRGTQLGQQLRIFRCCGAGKHLYLSNR